MNPNLLRLEIEKAASKAPNPKKGPGLKRNGFRQNQKVELQAQKATGRLSSLVRRDGIGGAETVSN